MKLNIDDIANLMQRNLISNAADETLGTRHLEKAADFLNSAADLFEDAGLYEEAEAVTQILEKLAAMPDLKKVHQEAEKEVQNLKHTGTMFSFDKNDVKDADLDKELDLDDEDVEKLNQMLDFEDEK